MDIDQARYILRELYNELRSEYPNLRWYTHEHGSVSFAIPNGDKENTLLAARSIQWQSLHKLSPTEKTVWRLHKPPVLLILTTVCIY